MGRRGPFTKLDLTFDNAYGGPGHAANPVGRGAAGGEPPPLEPADGAPRDVPACFAPINPAWAPRQGKRGKLYGAAWRKERAPYFAEDFDWTFFQSAPEVQQVDHLRGDEEITLTGLLPSAPTLRCRLPGTRVRTFIKDAEGKHQELAMALDTLYVDADGGTVTVVWRGLGRAVRHDLGDLVAALVVAEPLGDEGSAADHRAQLDAFAADPTGIKAAMPNELADIQERRRKTRAGEPLPDEAEIAKLDPVSATMRRALGTFAAKEQAEVAAQIAAAGPLPPQLVASLAELRVEHGETPPVPVIKKPGRMPTIGLVHTVRRVMGEVEKLKASLRGKEVPPEIAAKLVELDAIPHEPRLVEIDPAYHPPEPLSTDAPGPYADLRERDLSGLDLRGADLRGANLEDAILVRTNLRGAKLAGANLKRAVLFRADASLADFEGADFEGGNLASLVAASASFRGAHLDYAFFEAADLKDADLSEAEGEYTAFVGADLTRAKALGAAFLRCDFTGAQLESASFASSKLTTSVFEDVRAFRFDLTRCALDDARFPGAHLVEARLADARGHRSVWRAARLDRADFEGAWLTTAFFDDASAVATRFIRANLRRARMARVDLSRADLTDANLFEADLGSARLDKARFVRAHLYGASFEQAAGAGCDFEGANLRRSTLEAPP